MDSVITFLKQFFDINVLILFFISSFFLIYLDAGEFKNKDMRKEYKFSLYLGIAYIVGSIGVYVLMKFV